MTGDRIVFAPGQTRILVAEGEQLVAMLIEQALRYLGGECIGPISRMKSALT